MLRSLRNPINELDSKVQHFISINALKPSKWLWWRRTVLGAEVLRQHYQRCWGCRIESEQLIPYLRLYLKQVPFIIDGEDVVGFVCNSNSLLKVKLPTKFAEIPDGYTHFYFL